MAVAGHRSLRRALCFTCPRADGDDGQQKVERVIAPDFIRAAAGGYSAPVATPLLLKTLIDFPNSVYKDPLTALPPVPPSSQCSSLGGR